MRRLRFAFWVVIWGSIGIAGLAAKISPLPDAPANAALTTFAPATPNAATPPPEPAPQPALPVSPDRVISHLTHSIAWYRSMVALQQAPADSDDFVIRDRLNQAALTVLRLAFDFGHAAAALAGKASATAANANGSEDLTEEPSDVDRAAARVAEKVATLQSQLSALDDQIAHAKARDEATLTAKRAEVAAALTLTKEIQGTVEQIQRFEDTYDAHANGASGGLTAQVADLQKTVPELRQASSKGGLDGSGSDNASTVAANASPGRLPPGSAPSGGSPAGASVPATATGASPTLAVGTETFRPESAGVIALVGRWFSLQGAKSQLSDAIKQTDTLLKELEAVRGAVTRSARALASQSLDTTSTDPAQLAQSKKQFEAAVARFKQLATLMVPSGEQAIAVENARNTLSDWRDSMAAKSGTVARYLALHLGFLLGSVALVLVVSDVWRRATFRYLHDSRRRQQFLALRRVAVGVALAVVIVFGLVSEVGSLATYAGLITAGLAVALQNVILAVVAYFFLIGRYGVRVGDRITLAGVTGRVVEIGLIRIYLMELTGPELRPSGRMVVLSNAVLFQPTALFKQMPGGDYFWHTIMLTLAPTTDVSAAEKRLTEAANSVYENYRPAIEQQHAALQRFIDFETAMPRPEAYVRLTDKGLECTVRYPVEPARAASIDQKMLGALRAAQAHEPALESVGGPVLMTGDS